MSQGNSSAVYAPLVSRSRRIGAFSNETSDDEVEPSFRSAQTAKGADSGISDNSTAPDLASESTSSSAIHSEPSTATSFTSGKGKERAELTAEPAAEESESNWACHICLEEASEAVVTQCGHLMCWADLLSWWDNNPGKLPTCPVCKAPSGSDKVVPIYGRGRPEVDPRTIRKPRPKPIIPRQRILAQPNTSGLQFHAGVFPFPGLGFSWQSGGTRIMAGDETGQRMQGAPVQPPPSVAALQLIGFLLMLSLFSSLLLA